MAKNYYAIVNKDTGKLLCDSGRLPIFWRKDVAAHGAKIFQDHIVQRVDIKELERLILSKTNKKAK